jgi:hypothetical protein
MRLLLRNSNARWSRMFRRELLWLYSEFRREGNFPGINCQVFAPAVFEIRRAPLETGFVLLRRYLIHAEQSPPPMWLLNSCCFLWCIFLSVMLDRRPCTAQLQTFELQVNLPKSLYACSWGFITPRAKSNIARTKLLCRKSSSIYKSRAKVHLDGRHF